MKAMKVLTGFAFFILVSAFSSPGIAGYREVFFAKRFAAESFRSAGATVEALSFDSRIDPRNPKDLRTFKQRYWIDSQYAVSNDSPVLLYLCGEWTCGTGGLKAVMSQAREFKAHMLTIEHRFYGNSLPFPKLSSENLKYLTTELALMDFATIQKFLMQSRGWTGKWVVVGGSYAANLAAYYRTKYPDLVVGAWASSGPVRAEANFVQYDYHVALTAGDSCGEKMREVVKVVESAIDNPEELLKIKAMFDAEVLTETDDFLYLIADMGALAVQYGYRDEFCALVDSEDPLAGYATFTRKIFSQWGMNALSGSFAGVKNEDPSLNADPNMRQWYYQSCTEYGYWQNAYPDPKISVRSQRINLQYHESNCKNVFEINEPAHTCAMNQKFYKPILNSKTTNILFVNGSQDPWSELSILAGGANDVNPNLTLFTVQGAAHCDDLGPGQMSDSESMKQARALILEKLALWLAK